MSDLDQTDSPGELRTDVSRDNTFSRSAADRGWVIDLGRDFELAFLQISPTISARLRRGEDENMEEGYETKNSLYEVARIRMSPFGAMMLSMQCIEKLVTSDKIDGRALLDELTKIVDRHEAEGEVAVDEDVK